MRETFGRCAQISGKAVPCVKEDRMLGAYISFTKRRTVTTFSKKLGVCLDICGRIEASLLPLPVRATLVASVVVPKAIYGSAATPVSKKDMRRLRVACTRAIWGQSSKWRSPEIVHTLLSKGHVTDPLQAFHYNTLGVCRRVLQRHPEIWALYHEVFCRREDGPECAVGGPIKALFQAVRMCGGTWGENAATFIIQTSDKGPQPVCVAEKCSETYKHLLREGLRMKQWQTVHCRRDTLGGISTGINRAATMGLQNKLPVLTKYRWRCILTGALPTYSRLFKMGKVESPSCPCCGMEPETTDHVFS